MLSVSDRWSPARARAGGHGKAMQLTIPVYPICPEQILKEYVSAWPAKPLRGARAAGGSEPAASAPCRPGGISLPCVCVVRGVARVALCGTGMLCAVSHAGQAHMRLLWQVDNASKPMSLKLIMEREKVDHMLASGQVCDLGDGSRAMRAAARDDSLRYALRYALQRRVHVQSWLKCDYVRAGLRHRAGDGRREGEAGHICPRAFGF